MQITVVGGGNIGTQFAVHCAEKEHSVIIYTSCPDLFSNQLSIVDDRGVITHNGNICTATFDPEKAFINADVIFVTYPASMMNRIADIIFNYSSADAVIGIVPGNGGGECAFRKCIDRGNILFGIERVPAIARLVKKGESVRSTGYRNELHVAALPKGNAYKCAELVESIFDIKTTVIPNYLNLTMTPSNPILHSCRLKTMFGGWKEGVTYDRVPLFYEEWNDEASELLIACDEEVQHICKALREFELEHVKSLKIHYESETAKDITEKLSSIEAFKGIYTPMIQKGDGFIPDLNSRYFTADFSYGLSVIKQIAVFADVITPNIDSVMEWYRGISIIKNEFFYSEYGINDLSDLKSFYIQ